MSVDVYIYHKGKQSFRMYKYKRIVGQNLDLKWPSKNRRNGEVEPTGFYLPGVLHKDANANYCSCFSQTIQTTDNSYPLLQQIYIYFNIINKLQNVYNRPCYVLTASATDTYDDTPKLFNRIQSEHALCLAMQRNTQL